MWPLVEGILALDWSAVLAGFVAAAILFAPPKPPMPANQHPAKTVSADRGPDDDGAEYQVSSRITNGDRCIVHAYINGRGPFAFIADSGAPDLWFNVQDLPRLGIARSSLSFAPFGEREGNVAWVTLADVRVGKFVAHNVNAAISDQLKFRLLGMSVLRQGHLEVAGDTCTLRFPSRPRVPTN